VEAGGKHIHHAHSTLATLREEKINSAEGIITKTADCTVEEAVSKIKSLLVIRGITLFAVIDHSGEAEAIGMKMPDTKLVIFGNSKGGTLCFKGLLFQTRTYVALLVAAPVFCQCIPIATSDSSIISEMIPHEITQ
jgi:hypothetical protein